MTAIRQNLAGVAAVVADLSSNRYGNLTAVTGPTNLHGQRYALAHTYDPQTAT